MALDQTRANEILTHLHGGTQFPAFTAPIRLRIFTVIGTATTTGTEVATGGGYTSGVGAPSTAWAAASAGSQATNAAVTITNYPRAETVVAGETFTSDGTPKRIEWGGLAANKAMQAGDTLSFASGAIVSTLA